MLAGVYIQLANLIWRRIGFTWGYCIRNVAQHANPIALASSTINIRAGIKTNRPTILRENMHSKATNMTLTKHTDNVVSL